MGGTHGAITTAVNALQAEGYSVSSANVRFLNPLPADLGEILKGFDRVLVPELNNGQLSMLLRARYLVDAIPFGKLKGRPFKVKEIRERALATSQRLICHGH